MSFVEILCAAYVALALPNADVACENMETIVDVSYDHDIDPSVLVSLIYIESRWSSQAVSTSGACGLTQILPRYSGGFRGRFGKKLSCKKLLNPKINIQRGAQIFGYYLDRYNDNYIRSLCSYNAGWSRCRKRRGNHKGYRYARKVIRLAEKIDRKIEFIQVDIGAEVDVPGCYE